MKKSKIEHVCFECGYMITNEEKVKQFCPLCKRGMVMAIVDRTGYGKAEVVYSEEVEEPLTEDVEEVIEEEEEENENN